MEFPIPSVFLTPFFALSDHRPFEIVSGSTTLYFIIQRTSGLDGFTPFSSWGQPSNICQASSVTCVYFSQQSPLLLASSPNPPDIKITALLHLRSGHILRRGLSNLSFCEQKGGHVRIYDPPGKRIMEGLLFQLYLLIKLKVSFAPTER